MESGHSLDGNEVSLSDRIYSIPHIIWKRPPKFNLKEDWEVAAGEESRESEYQKQRELAVLEAVYPRKTSIPSSPLSLPTMEVSHRQSDHHEAPLIPVVPVEETNAIITPTSNTKALSSVEKPPSTPLPSMEADVPAAASVVLTAILKSSEQGSLIDTNLLIKILNDPKMLDKLTQTSDEAVAPFLNKEMADSHHSNTSHTPSFSPLSYPETNGHTASIMGPHIGLGTPHPDPHCHIRNFPHMDSHPTYPMPSVPSVQAGESMYGVHSSDSFWRETEHMPYSYKGGSYYKSLVSLHGGEREKKDGDHFMPPHLIFDDVNRTEEVKQSTGNDSLYFQAPFEDDIHMAKKRWRRSN